MVLFGTLLHQFVSSFARAYVLSTFEFDTDCFIDFPTRILINRLNGLETFFLSLIYKNPRFQTKMKIYIGVDGDICINLEF